MLKLRHLASAALGLALLAPSGASAATDAGAVISNGTAMLGVNNFGSLNYRCGGESEQPDRAARDVAPDPAGCPDPTPSGTTTVGIRYVPTNNDATAAGCACEGWGVADAASGLAGGSSVDNAPGLDYHLTPVSFTATATSATSVVDVTDADHPGEKLRVTHAYAPSTVSKFLYRVDVSVENLGAAPVADLRYRRDMDWDAEPTPYNEWVTLKNVSSRQLLHSSDDGFASVNPLDPDQPRQSGSVCADPTGVCEFTDLGYEGEFPTATSPSDHGALFDFKFGSLAPGATSHFAAYYGAAPTEADALQAISDEGLSAYSLGEPNCGNGDYPACPADSATDDGVLRGKPNTFVFGFLTSDVDLSVTAAPAKAVTAGAPATFNYTVRNAGPDVAPRTKVTVPLPAGLDFESATIEGGTCTYSAPDVVCEIRSLAAGASATVSLVVVPRAAGTLSLRAKATSSGFDADTANDEAGASVTVAAPPSPAPVTPTAPTVATTPTTSTATTATPTATVPVTPVAPVAPAPAAAPVAVPLPCVSKRRFTIHWRLPKGVRVKSTTVALNGIRYAKVGGASRTKVIDLQGRSPETIVVRLTATTTAGRKLGLTRTFRTCVTNGKKAAARPLLLEPLQRR